MPESDANDLLARYDTQLRTHIPSRLPEGVRIERDGPLYRFVGFSGGGFVGYGDLDGLEGAELDQLIARQIDVFAERGEPFEWKLHGHDHPPDLADRLLAAGFVPEELETVVIGSVSSVAGEVMLPDGVTLREVSERVDLERIGVMEAGIHADGRDAWLAESLDAEIAADPGSMSIVVAEAGAEMVCAGWVRFVAGTEFATLWGGGTAPAWRRRGIYRAVVACRANLAAERGFGYLQVDASSQSRPILERLGFIPVTTTTPFVWSPTAVRLRDVRPEDVAVFFEHQADPEASQMAAFKTRDLEPFIAHWETVLANGAVTTKTIEFEGRTAGNIGCWEQDGGWNVGYWLGREFWGRGIATAALSAFLVLVPTRPLYAHVATHNIGSLRVLEKCGFEPVGDGPGPPDADGIQEVLLRLDR